jgi:hypothetical protein
LVARSHRPGGAAFGGHLHVLGPEAQLADVGEDLRDGLDEAAIEEDVALRRSDEKRRDLVRADVVNVADQLEGLDRLVPAAARRIGLGEQRGQDRKPGMHA